MGIDVFCSEIGVSDLQIFTW